MEELLSHFGGGPPTQAHLALYRAWARGGWGMIITGNVAIDSTHLGTPFDITLPSPSAAAAEVEGFRAAFRAYADAVTGRDQASLLPASERPLGIVQLVHAGRQSMRGSGRSILAPSLAPSAIPMRPTAHLGPLGTLFDKALWGTAEEMSIQQIQSIKDRFIEAALMCQEAGFDGVELHASHGYQLAAFLSPKTNQRCDKYGGSAENRARLLMEIIDEVRAKVEETFLLGVKLNSSDYVHGGLTEDDALRNVAWLAEHGGVDFVEISGGNYENPSFVMEGFDSDAEKAKLSGLPPTAAAAAAPAEKWGFRREAFFASFAQQCRRIVASSGVGADGEPRLKLILTGGLRSRAGIASVLSPPPTISSNGDGDGDEHGYVDMACLGRPAALFPDLPKRLLDSSLDDRDADTPAYTVPAIGALGRLPIKLVGAGWGTLWHSLMMVQIVHGLRPDPAAIIFTLFYDLVRAPSTSANGQRRPPASSVLSCLAWFALSFLAAWIAKVAWTTVSRR
ncbi:hypothetical protein ACQY0O_000133 [Thecaphora frezii]